MTDKSIAQAIESAVLTSDCMRWIMIEMGHGVTTTTSTDIVQPFDQISVVHGFGDGEETSIDVKDFFLNTDAAFEMIPVDHGIRIERQNKDVKVLLWRLGGAYPTMYHGKAACPSRAIMAAVYRSHFDIKGYE